jgi:cysteine desulfurase/selenocysteine lyase
MASQTLHPMDLVPLDPVRAREDFPILSIRPHGKRLIYLDNAATTQKPRQVIDAIRHYYEQENANVHRGVHHLSERATEAYEAARKKVQRFFNIPLSCEVVFTRGATESINLVAQSYGRAFLREGDEIVLTRMEHHSNIVPWQMVCQEKGARIRVAPMNERGELLMDDFARLLNERTRLVSVVHVSNALGTVNPVRDIIRLAHERRIPVLLDGAQSAPHMPVDVQELGCDFFVCSGHKMYGPTGIGVLYGRGEWLDRMPPWQGGGDMIMSVTFEKTTYNTAPYKFEAGTPNIAGAVGLGAAVDYLSALGMDRVAAHEQDLLEHGTRLLGDIPGLRLIGTAARKAGVLSFVMDMAHPHDIGQILDEEGIAIRAGHHCAQPVMDFYGVPATARASLGVYTTREDLDALANGIRAVKEMFD